jgi:hypothetical protein
LAQERLKDWEVKEAQARAEVVALKGSAAAAAKREQEQRNLILELKKDQEAREGKERQCVAPPAASYTVHHLSCSGTCKTSMCPRKKLLNCRCIQ